MKSRLSLLLFLVFAIQGAWASLFTIHLDALHFGPEQIAWACATTAIAYLAAPFAAGQLADRWLAAERCIALGGMVSGILLWVLAWLEEPVPVICTCFGFWLVMVPLATIANALTFTHLSDPERNYGRIRVWGTIGWVASAWLTGLWLWLGRQEWWDDLFPIVGWAPFRPALTDIFRLGALFAFLLGFYGLTLPHTPPKRRGQNWLAPLQALGLLRERDLAVYMSVSLVLYATIPFSGQVSSLLFKSLGIADEYIAPLATIAQSSEVLMLLLMPTILGRLGMRATMGLGLTAWTTGFVILGMGWPTWLVVAAPACNGPCIVCYMVVGQVFLNSRTAGHIRASTQSLLVFFNGVGLLAGNFLAGQVRAWTAPEFAPTLFTAAGMGLALVIFFLGGFSGASRPPLADVESEPGPRLAYDEQGEKVQ